MYRNLIKLFFIYSLLSAQANAIAVSSLFEAASDNTHSASFSIANNDGKDMFVNLEMVKVKYVDGEKQIISLNKDTMKDWNFNISPSQMILAPGERKTVRMHTLCEKNDCEFNEDQIYAVDVNPVPYTDGKAANVAVAFGYRVYYLDPAQTVDLNYNVKRTDSGFIFDNKSNTMLTAVLNTCTKEYSSDCIFQYRVLPNSKKTFTLPSVLKDEKALLFDVINANESIHEKISI